MKKISASLVAASFLITGLFVTIRATPPKIPFVAFQPGQFREINQKLKINVVFIGFERGTGPQQINEATFRSYLSQKYRTLNLQPTFHGYTDWIGNSFDYNYNIVYANRSFENQFFGFLTNNRDTGCVVTYAQEYYNQEPSHTVNITDNSCIDSTKTEKWLGDHSASIGVDSSQYTVFFINWWGRPDFHFHTYANYLQSDVDADTGDNSADYQYYETAAWGGTTPDDEQNGLGKLKRVWFYDLSAGPDGNTYNYDLSTADIDGDGYLDYRIPPIWEYGNNSAYRPFDDLSGDLSGVLRYVAIDCMFTTSPFYNPALAERLPTSIQTDISYFDGDPPARGRDLTTPARAKLEWGKLRPFNTITTKQKDRSFTGEAASLYQCAFPYWNGQQTNCYPGRSGPNIWDLNLYHADHLNEYLSGNSDYQIQEFTYTLPAGLSPIPLGVAFPNGPFRPGFTYSWLPPDYRQYQGNTYTLIHEVGHHLGVDHPHDAFDYEDNSYYKDWFLRLGDESDTVMSYMFLSNNFSQFDRDNTNRWMTAININSANKLLPGILANNQYVRHTPQLIAADLEAALAIAAYKAMEYKTAAALAKNSYDRVLQVADSLGVQPPPFPGSRSVGNSQMGEERPIVESERFNKVKNLQDPMWELRAKSSSQNRMLEDLEQKGFLKAVPDKK